MGLLLSPTTRTSRPSSTSTRIAQPAWQKRQTEGRVSRMRPPGGSADCTASRVLGSREMATAARNEKHVLDYLDAIGRGDHARALEAFAEDATWTTPPSLPWPGVFRGRKAIFEEYFAVDKGLFTTGMSSYDLETRNVVSAGDCVVVEMRHRAE